MIGDQGGFQARWGERADTNPLLQDAQRQYAQIQALRGGGGGASPPMPGGGAMPSGEGGEGAFSGAMAQSQGRVDEIARQKAAAEALKSQSNINPITGKPYGLLEFMGYNLPAGAQKNGRPA